MVIIVLLASAVFPTLCVASFEKQSDDIVYGICADGMEFTNNAFQSEVSHSDIAALGD